MPDYRKAAARAAQKYGVDPKIFLAMIQQESGFNPNARSGAGAQGIAQFMPGTAKGYGVNLNDGRVTDDLEGAARYIRDNLAKTGGNYHQALSIYNSGRPDAYKDPGFAGGQTYNYVRSILGAAGGERLQGAGGGGGQKGSAGATISSTTTRTIPGVDNSQERRALVAAYLANTHDPSALTALAAGLLGAKDTPSKTVTSTKTTKGKAATGGQPAAKGLGPLRELFWQGAGGIDAKNGQKVPQGFVSGHTDHVHVASGPKTVVELGHLAQSMGLHVGENPHFGGVHPVHTKTSYHYKGEAIDVSGPPELMRKFAHRVAALYHIK
jgi:hypothetical protein